MRDRDILELRAKQEAIYEIRGPDQKLRGNSRIVQDFGPTLSETDCYKGVVTFCKRVSDDVDEERTVRATGKTPLEVLRKLEKGYIAYYGDAKN